MVRIQRVVALVSIITLSMIAATVVGGGILGINIAPTHNNYQAIAQQIGNQTTMAANQTMAANPDFDAILSGASEVPPVQTNASGFVDLDVEIEDGQRVVDYHLYVNNSNRVTQAHIHQGNSSENGPIIVPLFNASNPTGPVSGELVEGHITPANFVGSLQGKQLDDLIALMQNGTAYVNVHTEQNPQGEIRGTVLLDDSAFEGEEDDFEDDDEGEGEDDDFEDENG
ncbi:MAG: CHRD domain-containing protein [Thermoproteota archaeon]|nr:CHRD domain-containing protein [Thermoproteota archaeon]